MLETHPDKLPPTASEEEKELALDLFHQVTLQCTSSPETCSHIGFLARSKRHSECWGTPSCVGYVPRFFSRIKRPPTTPQAYEVHHRPLPEQTPTRTKPRPSTPSTTTTPAPTPTPTASPPQASTPPRANRLTLALTERPHSEIIMALERFDETPQRQMEERSTLARKSEERRLDKPKAYVVSEEIQSFGQNQAALVEKMIQDLFSLTPEWEIRRMKARAVSTSLFSLIPNRS